MPTWTRRALTVETMTRQGLASRPSIGVTDAVRSAVALQAQEPAAPYVALWNRVGGFDPNDLDRALSDGTVVKSSLLRFTLHLAAGEDAALVRAAMTGRMRDAGYVAILEDAGLTSNRLDDILQRLTDLLSAPLDDAAVEDELSVLVPDAADPARLWSALRMVGGFRHAPSSEPWSFGRRTTWLPSVTTADDDGAAISELVRRYLESYGPATIADMAQFTLLKKSTLKHAVGSTVGVVPVDGPDGPQLFDVIGDRGVPGDDPSVLPARLLGMWDNLLLAHADRSRVVADEHRQHVIRRNGDVLPTVLVEGRVRGVWRSTEDAIDVRAFAPIDDATLGQLDDEARDLRSMLTGREPLVFSRAAGWWDRLPDGPTITIGA